MGDVAQRRENILIKFDPAESDWVFATNTIKYFEIDIFNKLYCDIMLVVSFA